MKDAMAGFELYQPTDLDTALESAARFGEAGWILAGGYDSLDWFKDRVKVPEAVIDLSNIGELHGIREVDGGIEIGAMTTLTEVSRSPLVRGRFQL
ncbi:MAG: xanthine dehydrogenase family protein subunit M, partial [Gemmatimonadetes bacterium]|nr:xanthine dehydrogenase family protein subunit M [Gemmatimonadota bacterium]